VFVAFVFAPKPFAYRKEYVFLLHFRWTFCHSGCKGLNHFKATLGPIIKTEHLEQFKVDYRFFNQKAF